MCHFKRFKRILMIIRIISLIAIILARIIFISSHACSWYNCTICNYTIIAIPVDIHIYILHLKLHDCIVLYCSVIVCEVYEMCCINKA